MLRLKNKVTVITGGNSGIGKGIAKRFFKEGANVVVFGRKLETLNQISQELDGSILTVQGDITNTQDIKTLYEKTYAHYGKIDSIIVNAGVGERLHIKDVDENNFDYIVNTNYRGAYFTVKYAVDYLNENASIILIGSIAAHLNIKCHSVYASTYTRSLYVLLILIFRGE